MPNLPALVVGPVATQRAVTVLPLFTDGACLRADYRLGCEALAAGVLEVHELEGRGAVNRLVARNRGRERVLLLEGDHLVGAKQNRVLTSSAIVGGQRNLTLPVSCVEQGRWQGASSRFSAAAQMAPAGVRRLLKLSVTSALVARRERVADQYGVWTQIAAQQQRLRVTSATRALSHSYAERASDIAEVASHFPYPVGATGVAIGIGDELISLDVFDRTETCAFYWRRLVESAALEGIGRSARAAVGATEVQAIVDRLRSADWARVDPVGEGEELRARTNEAAASMLTLDGALVHFGVATGVQVQSTPRVMQRRTPEVLADHYRIDARIGVGGAKEVFRATDTRDGRVVAIARVPWVDADEFASEVELARRVRSKYAPEIYDAFVDEHEDGYLVMEFCEGKTLAQLADGPLAVADVAPIIVELARGIAAIHEAHVLHRDVKLENVLLCPRADGVALKILDFGISARARSSATDVHDIRPVSGTLPYMSREALLGQRLDARSDVYSFAISCFRLLVGELPVLPHEDESEFAYLQRLRFLDRHDLSRLPPLPAPVVALFARMLEPEAAHRPYMPEVVAVLERELGRAPISPTVRPARRVLPLERVTSIELALASPDHMIVAACAIAPLVAITPGTDGTTTLRAIGEDGRARWTCRVDGVLTAGLRADLDGDGVREIYLAGPDRIVALTAAGNVRFSHARTGGGSATLIPIADPETPRTIVVDGRTHDGRTGGRSPTLIAIADPETPRIVVDGRMHDARTGHELGPLYRAYEGNGRELVEAPDAAGVSLHGRAMQAFRGDHHAPAAIVGGPDDRQFLVAHLEDASPDIDSSAIMPGRRITLVIYGPGGKRVRRLVVARPEVPTGDLAALQRVHGDRTALFGPDQAPLAVRDTSGGAVVIVPLLDADAAIAPVLIAFAATEVRPLWHHVLERRGGRAVLADCSSAGKPSLVLGDGHQLIARDPWTGTPSEPLACTGLPVAYGDPFGSGRGHLVTVGREAIEIWRGPACARYAMQWTGARGNQWRSGAFGFGPR